MSQRPPAPPLYPKRNVQAYAMAATHAPPVASHTLPLPSMMTSSYPQGPSPARLQPLSIPSMRPERPQHVTHFTHRYAPHLPPQNFQPPVPQAAPSRWPPAAPLDRLLHIQDDASPSSSSAYSPRYSSQTSPRATDNHKTLQRRPPERSPFENPPMPGISELVPGPYNVPPLPSPSFTTHRGSVESHHSSGTSSSGLGPSPMALPGVSTAPSETTQSRYVFGAHTRPTRVLMYHIAQVDTG